MTLSPPPAQRRQFLRLASRGPAVFIRKGGDYTVFYAPRLACVLPAAVAAEVEKQIQAEGERCASAPAARLLQAAKLAERETGVSSRELFSPECLTLFLNNDCNLKCSYCHAEPGCKPGQPISSAAVHAASEIVAASCAKRNCAFTVAFHGGGEPSLDVAQVARILDVVRDTARRHDVLLRTYIATNGVMTEQRAGWLAARFDLVGLSCDGPPDVQDAQRAARDGHSTSAAIEATAFVLRQSGRPFHVRATITRKTLGRQAELVDYFINRLVPGEVRLEPVYVNPACEVDLAAEDAFPFAAGFLHARSLAAERSVPVTTSLTRPAEVFGRHCNVLRHVLNLAPGDVATGCFLESRESGAVRRRVLVGRMNPATGFECDQERIRELAVLCSEIPAGCRDCLCCYQCTHGCPDVCAVQPSTVPAPGAHHGFRCEATRILMEALIGDAAESAWQNTPRGVNRDVQGAQGSVPVAVYRGSLSGVPAS